MNKIQLRRAKARPVFFARIPETIPEIRRGGGKSLTVVLYVGVLLVYFAVMIFIGVRSRKTANSVQGFVLGSRSVGPWLSAFAYGTSYFSAVIFIGYAGQFGWNFGIAATWIGIGNALLGSLLPWAILGRRTRVMTQQLGSATMPDYFGKRFGDKKLKIAASVIVFVFLIPYTASLYKGLGSLFEMAFGIDYWICIIIMAVITGIYVIIGGYMATAWNDFVQGIIMIFGIVIVIAAVLSNYGGLSEALATLSQESVDGLNGAYVSFFGPDLYGLIMVIFLTSVGTWGLPQMVQKYYAIRDEGAIKKGMIISTLFAFIVAGGCYFLGGFGRLLDGDYTGNYDAIIPGLLSDLNPAVIALVLVLVVAASMSTLASLVMNSSSTITLDLICPARKKETTQKQQMLMIRIFVAVFIVISAAIAIVYEEMKISFIAQMMGVSWGGLAGAFLAPYLYSLYWKKTSKTACWTCFAFGVCMSILSLVISLLNSAGVLPASFTESFLYTYLFSSSIYVGTWTMIAGMIIVPVVSLFTKSPDEKITEPLFAPFVLRAKEVSPLPSEGDLAAAKTEAENLADGEVTSGEGENDSRTGTE